LSLVRRLGFLFGPGRPEGFLLEPHVQNCWFRSLVAQAAVTTQLVSHVASEWPKISIASSLRTSSAHDKLVRKIAGRENNVREPVCLSYASFVNRAAGGRVGKDRVKSTKHFAPHRPSVSAHHTAHVFFFSSPRFIVALFPLLSSLATTN